MNTHGSLSNDAVTVVIPTYNYAHFLKEAIKSVVDQSHENIIIIVIDDGSTDNTKEVVCAFPDIRYHYQINSGLSSARNRGLELTSTNHVLFLDADDRLLPTAISSNLNKFQLGDYALVAGSYRLIDRAGARICHQPLQPSTDNYYYELIENNFIGVPASVMFRTSGLKEIGGFDTTLTSAEDFDVYLKLTRISKLYYHHSEIVEYRKHGESMSANSIHMHSSIHTVLRRQLEFSCNDPIVYTSYEKGCKFWDEIFSRRIVADILYSAFSLNFTQCFYAMKYLSEQDSLSFLSGFMNLVVRKLESKF